MMLTAPATLSDVAAIYGLSRGIPLDPSSAAGKRGKHVNVKVYGGQLTEGIQRAADQFHVKNMKADWARSTGSSPAAIRWLTEQS